MHLTDEGSGEGGLEEGELRRGEKTRQDWRQKRPCGEGRGTVGPGVDGGCRESPSLLESEPCSHQLLSGR